MPASTVGTRRLESLLPAGQRCGSWVFHCKIIRRESKFDPKSCKKREAGLHSLSESPFTWMNLNPNQPDAMLYKPLNVLDFVRMPRPIKKYKVFYIINTKTIKNCTTTSWWFEKETYQTISAQPASFIHRLIDVATIQELHITGTSNQHCTSLWPGT